MKSLFIGHILALTSVALAAAACAESNSLGDGRDAEAPPPNTGGFTTPDAGGDAGTDLSEAGPTTLMCASNKCTGTFATCPNSANLCDTDLANDVNNCGRCGFACGDGVSGLKFNCSEGTCQPAGCGFNAVGVPLGDCDGFLDNGCEITLGTTTEHCAACGDKCAPGVACIFDNKTYRGTCGCAAPLLDCSGGAKCTDPRIDDANCGTCGTVCEPPEGLTAPPHSHYGCGNSECGKLKCDQAPPYYNFTDCNNDIKLGAASDGCEVDLARPDNDNCGACNNKCKDGQQCFFDQMRGPICECPAGTRFCSEQSTCIDTSADPNNCGGCSLACPTPAEPVLFHATATCRSGQCGTECQEGWADCNGDMRDGCEVDLSKDPDHCGECGVSCDHSILQPCVGGKCAVEPCGGPK